MSNNYDYNIKDDHFTTEDKLINNNNWWSLAQDTTLDNQSYCEYCFKQYRLYHEILNGICRSCGRPIDYIKKNKQENPEISSLSKPLSPDDLGAVSMIIDSSPIFKNDKSTYGDLGDGITMSADSIGEATSKLLRAESKSNIITTNNNTFTVKTTGDKKKQSELGTNNDS